VSRVMSITTHSMEKGAVKRVGDYVIEKGIPVPPRQQGRTNAIADVLRAMEVGESFVHRRRVGHGAIKQTKGKKFVQRKVGQGPSYRVWRIA